MPRSNDGCTCKTLGIKSKSRNFNEELDITEIVNLLQSYSYQLKQRERKGNSRPQKRIVIFILGKGIKDADKVMCMIRKAQKQELHAAPGAFNFMFFSVAQKQADMWPLEKLDGMGRDEEDNVDSAWVPAQYVIFPPPAELVCKILVAGTIRKYDDMHTDCRGLYTSKQQVECGKLGSRMLDIQWDCPPYTGEPPPYVGDTRGW